VATEHGCLLYEVYRDGAVGQGVGGCQAGDAAADDQHLFVWLLHWVLPFALNSLRKKGNMPSCPCLMGRRRGETVNRRPVEIKGIDKNRRAFMPENGETPWIVS
jgi:hypothetical protein